MCNHCSHCLFEDYCAINDWSLYESYDPCCPNMKEGRKQFKEFLDIEFKNNDYIDFPYFDDL